MQGRTVEDGFWPKLADKGNDRSPESLEQTIRGRRVFGEHRVARQPGRPYFSPR